MLRCGQRVSVHPARSIPRPQDEERSRVQMQAKQLWQAVLGDLQVRLSKNAFENWIRPTTIVGFENDVATVAAANTFGASTLQARYSHDIEQVMSDIVGRPVSVEFTVLR